MNRTQALAAEARLRSDGWNVTARQLPGGGCAGWELVAQGTDGAELLASSYVHAAMLAEAGHVATLH